MDKPEDVAWFERGQEASRAGNLAQAAAAFRTAYNLKNQSRSLNALADTLLKLGSPGEALELIQAFPPTKRDMFLLDKLGRAAMALGDYSLAAEAFLDACQRKPEMLHLQSLFVDALMASTPEDGPEQVLRSVVEQHSWFHRAREKLAELTEKRGDLREALRLSSVTFDARPDLSANAGSLARLQASSGDIQRGIATLKVHLSATEKVVPHRLRELSQLHAREGEFPAAIAARERLITEGQARPIDWLELARLKHKAGSREDAIVVLRRAAEQAGPHSLFQIEHVTHLLDLGFAAEGKRQLQCMEFEQGTERSTVLAAAAQASRLADHGLERAILLAMPLTPERERCIAQSFVKEAESVLDDRTATAILDRLIADFPTQTHLYGWRARLAVASLDVDGAESTLSRARQITRSQGRRLGSMGLALLILEELRVHTEVAASARTGIETTEIGPVFRALLSEPASTAIAVAALRLLAKQGAFARKAGLDDRLSIPKLIWQFWDSRPIPPDVAVNMATWHEMHPDWAHHAFSVQTAKEFLADLNWPDLRRAFRYARLPAQKADLLRLAVLHEHGGIYADADDRCLTSFEPSLVGRELVLRQEEFGSAGNNFIAVEPRHPVIEHALEDAVAATIHGGAESIWLKAGPGALSRALALHLAANPRAHRIALMPSIEFQKLVWVHCRLDYKRQGKAWQILERLV